MRLCCRTGFAGVGSNCSFSGLTLLKFLSFSDPAAFDFTDFACLFCAIAPPIRLARLAALHLRKERMDAVRGDGAEKYQHAAQKSSSKIWEKIGEGVQQFYWRREFAPPGVGSGPEHPHPATLPPPPGLRCDALTGNPIDALYL